LFFNIKHLLYDKITEKHNADWEGKTMLFVHGYFVTKHVAILPAFETSYKIVLMIWWVQVI
jgi:hypothetical protein